MASIQAIAPVHQVGGGTPYTAQALDEASQTFIKGAVVTFDGTSRELEVSASPVAEAADVLGIAAEDAKGVTSSVLQYYPGMATLGIIFGINLQTDGDADADDQIAATDLWTKIGLIIDQVSGGTAHWVADKGQAADAYIHIIDFIDVIGEVHGRVKAIFLHSAAHASVETV